jgi:hypothetical protein
LFRQACPHLGCVLASNALLCFHPHFVVVVPDADGYPDSMRLFNGCSGACFAPWNALRCLHPVFTRLKAARPTSRSPRFLRHWSSSEPPPGSVNGALLPAGSFFNIIYTIRQRCFFTMLLPTSSSLRSASPLRTLGTKCRGQP